jgi:hypothetical protein
MSCSTWRAAEHELADLAVQPVEPPLVEFAARAAIGVLDELDLHRLRDHRRDIAGDGTHRAPEHVLVRLRRLRPVAAHPDREPIGLAEQRPVAQREGRMHPQEADGAGEAGADREPRLGAVPVLDELVPRQLREAGRRIRRDPIARARWEPVIARRGCRAGAQPERLAVVPGDLEVPRLAVDQLRGGYTLGTAVPDDLDNGAALPDGIGDVIKRLGQDALLQPVSDEFGVAFALRVVAGRAHGDR